MSLWVPWIQVDNIQAPEKGKIIPASGKIQCFLLLNKVDIVRMHRNSDLGNSEWCLQILNVEADTRGVQSLSFAILSFQTSSLLCCHGNESQHINKWFKKNWKWQQTWLTPVSNNTSTWLSTPREYERKDEGPPYRRICWLTFS